MPASIMLVLTYTLQPPLLSKAEAFHYNIIQVQYSQAHSYSQCKGLKEVGVHVHILAMVLYVFDVIRVDEGSSFLEFSAGIRYPGSL